MRWLARAPAGMSEQEARLVGFLPPLGHERPPRAPLGAIVRTVAAMTALAPELAYRFISVQQAARVDSSHTGAGRARMQEFCVRALGRFGVALDVEGLERVPREGGLVFMWNQTSHLDHLVLGATMPRPFLSLYNNAVARLPLYGEHLRRAGHFHVDNTNEAQWRASIERAACAVQGGACVLVSPEGTRSWDGRLLPMKRGAFLLARAGGRPIVCVTVVDAQARLPRGTFAVRPGRVRVVFSTPIEGEPLEDKVIAVHEAALSARGPRQSTARQREQTHPAARCS